MNGRGFCFGIFSFFSSYPGQGAIEKAAVSSLVLYFRTFEETSSSPTLNSVTAHKATVWSFSHHESLSNTKNSE